ncbi:MAG: hypothetical protein FJ276_34550 [Planctomycetes bacterium]|nr:hypothetical protein [Planctomycetota bacterium]
MINSIALAGLPLVLLCGCATGNRVLVPRVYELAETHNMQVYANEDWQQGPYRVQEGDFIRITAEGRWSTVGGNWDATGSAFWTAVVWLVPPLQVFHFVKPMPFAPFCCLVALFDNGDRVAVGREYSVGNESGRYSGPVYFMINDTELADNRGALNVQLQVFRKSVTPGDSAGAGVKSPTTGIAQRRAVVIGISDYQHRGKWNLTNLGYAARDAQAFAGYLKSPSGGRFDKVDVLMDGEATTRNVKAALREGLRGVQQEDFVVIFWAGHGSPDPHDERELYLVTHDTDPEHMASTAYAMREFKTDVERLKAQRVLVIADTCHSGGISDPSVALRGPAENRIVDGFRGLKGIGVGAQAQRACLRMVFTACEQGEKSRESADLGGGHGVFTWFLLQSLSGDADDPKQGGNGDGKVTLGEVIEATRDRVKRWTGNQQHPDTAGSFERSIVMGSVTQ